MLYPIREEEEREVEGKTVVTAVTKVQTLFDTESGEEMEGFRRYSMWDHAMNLACWRALAGFQRARDPDRPTILACNTRRKSDGKVGGIKLVNMKGKTVVTLLAGIVYGNSDEKRFDDPKATNYRTCACGKWTDDMFQYYCDGNSKKIYAEHK